MRVRWPAEPSAFATLRLDAFLASLRRDSLRAFALRASAAQALTGWLAKTKLPEGDGKLEGSEVWCGTEDSNLHCLAATSSSGKGGVGGAAPSVTAGRSAPTEGVLPDGILTWPRLGPDRPAL
jgi:hypothetical protein